MTSNIDLYQFLEKKEKKLTRNEVNKQLSQFFRPEFVNRIDEVVVFNPLTIEGLLKIAELQLVGIRQRLKEQGYKIEIKTDQLPKLLTGLDYKNFGARPLRRLLEEKVENPIANQIISGKIKKGEQTEWTIK